MAWMESWPKRLAWGVRRLEQNPNHPWRNFIESMIRAARAMS